MRRVFLGLSIALVALSTLTAAAVEFPTSNPERDCKMPFESDGIRFAYEPTVLFTSSADFVHAREPLLARRACWATELFYEHGEEPQLFFQTFVADRFYEELRPFVSVSRGEGWTEPKTPFGVPPNFTVRQGHILSDGSWLFPVYWQDCKTRWNSVVSYVNDQPQWDDWKWENYPFVSAAIRSTDKGKSWRVSNAMAGNEGVAWEIWEPCMVELEPGHVRMFARGSKPFLWEADSYDYVDAPIRIPSGRRIEATGAAIRLLDGTRTLMLFNAGAKDGTLAPISSDGRDSGITIVGGRWEDCCTNRCGYGRSGMFNLLPRKKVI